MKIVVRTIYHKRLFVISINSKRGFFGARWKICQFYDNTKSWHFEANVIVKYIDINGGGAAQSSHTIQLMTYCLFMFQTTLSW